MRAKKVLTKEEITEKIKHFCAYQERSKLQVLRKLSSLGCASADAEELLIMLVEENYFNEKRFVEQFVRSRSSAKGWGPTKIAMALQRETGENHREEIRQDDESKMKALEKLKKDLSKKRGELERKQDPQLREKLLRFCLSRGFSMEDALKITEYPGKQESSGWAV